LFRYNTYLVCNIACYIIQNLQANKPNLCPYKRQWISAVTVNLRRSNPFQIQPLMATAVLFPQKCLRPLMFPAPRLPWLRRSHSNVSLSPYPAPIPPTKSISTVHSPFFLSVPRPLHHMPTDPPCGNHSPASPPYLSCSYSSVVDCALQ